MYAWEVEGNRHGSGGVVDGGFEDVVVVISDGFVDGGCRPADTGDVEERIECGVVRAVCDCGVRGGGRERVSEFVV